MRGRVFQEQSARRNLLRTVIETFPTARRRSAGSKKTTRPCFVSYLELKKRSITSSEGLELGNKGGPLMGWCGADWEVGCFSPSHCGFLHSFGYCRDTLGTKWTRGVTTERGKRSLGAEEGHSYHAEKLTRETRSWSMDSVMASGWSADAQSPSGGPNNRTLPVD